MTNNITYFVANWKMFGSISSIKKLDRVVSFSKTKNIKRLKIIYCPPFPLIDRLITKTKKSKISVGAQDCFHLYNDGPHTGNVNARILKNIGCKYVILGHSERRAEGDTNKIINKKIHSAIANKLKVILCIGETLREKKIKKTNKVISKQLIMCLAEIKKFENIILAYEPVWSIGSGLVPENNELILQIKKIRNFMYKKFKTKKIKILYGGSVNQNNISNLKKIRNLDGFLIGGASQKTDNFIDIINKAII